MNEHHRTCDQFTCASCGRNIFSYPPRDPPPKLCASCAFIDEFVEDATDREALRKRMCGDDL